MHEKNMSGGEEHERSDQAHQTNELSSPPRTTVRKGALARFVAYFDFEADSEAAKFLDKHPRLRLIIIGNFLMAISIPVVLIFFAFLEAFDMLFP